MRHKKNTKKFRRTEEERKKLWITLSQALILNGRIVTFSTRAKWFRPKLERIITLCKKAGDDKQLAFRICRQYFSEAVSRKLIEEIVPLMQDRMGGYTSQLKLMSNFNSLDKSVVSLVK